MKQIQMNQSKNLSVDDAYDLFIRKCRVKNLSQASIVSYENKIQPFVDYCEGGLTEMIANLKTLQEMGAISKETIMEKTEYVSDVEVEKKRLSGENVSQDVSQKVDNPSKKVEIK